MSSVQALLDPFDNSNGNGSRNNEEDWLDGESIFDNEWGSQAATTFRPDEAPSYKQDKLERLYKRQNGKGDPDRKQEIRSSYIENDIKVFTSVLEMPEIQITRVEQIVDNLDISSQNMSKSYEKVILTVCSLISDEALSNRQNASFEERLFFTDEYKELMQCCKMSSKDHRRLRPLIREESDYFD